LNTSNDGVATFRWWCHASNPVYAALEEWTAWTNICAYWYALGSP
jgi:hypothetical protein